jgi:hypothetical protein
MDHMPVWMASLEERLVGGLERDCRTPRPCGAAANPLSRGIQARVQPEWCGTDFLDRRMS